MAKGLEETLDELQEIEGVEACILYRIDGVPITLRARGYKEHLLETMFWLEKQIKQRLWKWGDETRTWSKEIRIYCRVIKTSKIRLDHFKLQSST